MHYTYQIYGQVVISELELPALLPAENSEPSLCIQKGRVPAELNEPITGQSHFSVFNEHECLTTVPGVARYYTTGGNRVLVEPETPDKCEIALFIYSHCIPLALLQRNQVLLHVSGVFIRPGEVLLIAGPSGAGKSSTALMLEQLGYPLFTDDTALLSMESGKCYARASYPETRLWAEAAEMKLSPEEKRRVRPHLEKYAYTFDHSFTTDGVEVKGIVFLNTEGEEVNIAALNATETWRYLNDNTYVLRFIRGMNKSKLLFHYTTALAGLLPGWKALRPAGVKSYETFSKAIEEEIIRCEVKA